jgi:hypothetical protein
LGPRGENFSILSPPSAKGLFLQKGWAILSSPSFHPSMTYKKNPKGGGGKVTQKVFNHRHS